MVRFDECHQVLACAAVRVIAAVRRRRFGGRDFRERICREPVALQSAFEETRNDPRRLL